MAKAAERGNDKIISTQHSSGCCSITVGSSAPSRHSCLWDTDRNSSLLLSQPAIFPCPYNSGGSCQLQNAPALQEVFHTPSPANTLLSQEDEDGHGNSQSQHLWSSAQGRSALLCLKRNLEPNPEKTIYCSFGRPVAVSFLKLCSVEQLSPKKMVGFHGTQPLIFKLSFLSHSENHFQLQWYKSHWWKSSRYTGIFPKVLQNVWLGQN